MAIRILVIDDSLTIQKVIKIAFSRYDVNIAAASTYVEVVHELGEHKPDVLVIDAAFAGFKTVEDFQKLKTQVAGSNILLLVGSYENIDENKFRQAGFQHILRKPFESTDIVSSVSQLLGKELPLRTENPSMGQSAGAGGFPQPRSVDAGSPKPPPPPSRGGRVSVGEGSAGMPTIPISGREISGDPYIPGDKKSGLDEATGLTAETIAMASERRGQKAFSGQDDDFSSQENSRGSLPAKTIPLSREASVATASGAVSDTSAIDEEWLKVKHEFEQFLRDDAPVIVRKTIEAYCRDHFSPLAKEIITSELRRLAEERTRMLSER